MRVLKHSGVAHDDNPPGRGSGRFGYGTGENPGQHQYSFVSEVDKLRKKGLKDAEIAKILLGDDARGTDLKAELAIAKKAERKANYQRALKILDECDGNKSEAARRMGMGISSFNSLIDPIIAERTDKYDNTARMIKDVINANKNGSSKGIVDVSSDTGMYLGVADSTKDVAVKLLEKEGYVKGYVKIKQMGTIHETTVMVLAPPGTTQAEIQQNKNNIASITTFTPDKGKEWFVPEYPSSLDSSRVMIRYGDQGGSDKDGVIEIRRGVEDLSLGDAQYAQVRICVDDKSYMKGMAMYSVDKMPPGIDIIYNTNKKTGTAPEKVFKPMNGLDDNRSGTIDPENPFGALIMAGGQYHYKDKNGNDQLSPINKLREEGEWDSWSRTIASQFLSKQPIKMIIQQLDLSIAYKKNDLNDIMKLTNPVLKEKLLYDFADACDKNASDLSAKGFRNQKFQVLLPVPSLKDNEIYAPNFKDGDIVALCRYPHGATFEIPVLKVNNKNPEGINVIGDARDAVGINPRVAQQLSGADHDGDTAIAIPVKSNRLAIVAKKYPQELVDFDPKMYKLPDSAPPVTNDTKQKQMGMVTNLITDMTAAFAPDDEIIRAVKHSMVVIDSEKHHLDFKKSADDNKIHDLKVKYQGSINPETGRLNTGAATVFSRANSEVYVDQRKEVTNTKIMTPEELKRWNRGDKVYRPTGNKKVKFISNPDEMTPEELVRYKAGKKVYRQTDEPIQEKVTRMALADDAMTLVHNKSNSKEVAYAEYANSLKDLAREARKEARAITPTPVDVTAKKTYAAEVESLNAKINNAKANNPRERKATALANVMVAEQLKANPNMDAEHRKRAQAIAISKARAMVGAKKDKIDITDKEWEAIQANAISTSKLKLIVNNTDPDKLKKRATPKTVKGLNDSQKSLCKALYGTGMSAADLADKFGVSTSTIYAILKAA